MSGILGTSAPVQSDLNLLLQIAIIILLFTGFRFGRIKTGQGIKRHGRVMTVVVVLNAISIITVMLVSFITFFSTPIGELPVVPVASTAVHATLGAISEGLGIAFVLNKKPKSVKTWMRVTFTLWVITFLLGVFLYLQIAGLV